MDLSKLPPHLLITLGLSSCVLEACLSPDPTESTGPSDAISTGTGTGTGRDTTSSGACLGPPLDSSSSDTGTGTDTDGGTSSGGVLDEPALPSTRAAAVERVLSRGALPADVLDRLRALTGPGKE